MQNCTHGQAQLCSLLRESDCETRAGCQALHRESEVVDIRLLAPKVPISPKKDYCLVTGVQCGCLSTRVSHGSGFVTIGGCQARDLLMRLVVRIASMHPTSQQDPQQGGGRTAGVRSCLSGSSRSPCLLASLITAGCRCLAVEACAQIAGVRVAEQPGCLDAWGL